MNVGWSPEAMARARRHAALGEPARLAIVDRLVLGDASPGELGRVLGLPSNLLAHHVKLLEQADIIERSRSEGDHRRTYLRLKLAALTDLAPSGDLAAARVVFVCVHNAGRSQMALGFFQHLAGDRAVAWSGGSEPGHENNPSAIAAMAERGIDISGEFPKPWTDEIERRVRGLLGELGVPAP